ncbi:MAG: hypothetical protein EZS28_007799 [Streblomastix strix]|uniref:Protein kinase domain-containing protein n=1 Tax=Streblomastix strix TaxID=222440 RepID=A0A5J4WPY2_9EUKA|nr:MAG: hypothetical protein EZS28_007799 [Streblomastix strix]
MEGWDKVTILQKFVLREIRWWKKQLETNKPASLITLSPEAQLTTDASAWGWGGVLQLPNEEEIMVHGVWAKNWRLTSSNQRETASILCCLRRFESALHNKQIQALEILTDNTTTAYNIRRQAAAGPLVRLTQTILEWGETNKIQLSTTYLPGVANKVADSLSRLNRAGDYYIPRLKAQKIMKQLDVTATIDVFSTRSNRVVQRYCSPRIDSRAVARDGLKINWNKELAWIHSPIPLIGSCLNKIKEEQVQLAIIITPAWTSQFWSNLLNQLTVRRQEIGLCRDVLVPGRITRKRGWMLPPGKLIASLVSANPSQAKDYLDFALVRQDSQHKQFNVQQNLGKHNGEDTLELIQSKMPHVIIANWLSYLENKGLSHHAIKESQTSSSVLFDKAGIKLEQGLISSIMRKHYRESAKIQKEEVMWDLDILLNYIRRYAKKPFQTVALSTIRSLSIISIMIYTNLRLVIKEGQKFLSIRSVEKTHVLFFGIEFGRSAALNLQVLFNEPGALQLEKTVVLELDNYYSKLEFQSHQESQTLEPRLSRSSLAVVQQRKKLIVGHVTPYQQKLQGGIMIEITISLLEKQSQGLSMKSLSQEGSCPAEGAAYSHASGYEAPPSRGSFPEGSCPLRGALHIKPENIFLMEDGTIRLGDFGLGKELTAQYYATTIAGTKFYLAPEVYLQRRMTYMSDMFAFGVVLFELLTGKHPFQASNEQATIDKIKNGQNSDLPDDVPQEMKNIIIAMINSV